MSGFGGGGFGSNPPPPQQPGFGGGFGQSPPAPGVAAPFGGGGGFGSPPPQQPQGFGGSGFGGAAVPFGSAPTTSFAAPASFAGAPATGFGAPAFGTSTGFGSPPPGGGGGFGGDGFGQPPQQQQQQGFGGGNNNNNTNTGFGASTNNNPFGGGSQQQQQQQPSIQVPNPFGAPSSGAPAPAMSFGMSSNVVTSGSNNTSGLNANANSFQPSNRSDGNNNSGGMSFGAPASFNANPFGGGGGGQDSGGGGMTFGSSSSHRNQDNMGSSSSPTPAFGQTFHDPFGGGGGNNNNNNNNQQGPLQSIPEDAMGGGSGAGPFGGGGGGDGNLTWQKPQSDGGSAATEASPSTEQEDKLAQLKAKLEAKKKKLLDKQKKQQQDVIGSSSSTAQQQDPPLPPPALSRQPRATKQYSKDNERGGGHRRNRSTSPVPVNNNTSSMGGGMSSDNQSRAERNLQRFATNNTNTSTQAHLPSELRGMTEQPKSRPPAPVPSNNSGGEPTRKAVTSAVGGESNRETLANAKSLVGTCEYFCPDEELLRRERENDIQLLEIPDPGGIHPAEWTLRNTVVKRFRRSAADYKLDVPEWVRPPDVLEAACAYLEEWVMERDRQGPDRRFPQNGTPVSMDAYQFIWDRTRMIRKDFILQNFVGTGGKCDARAVRCHERIARWHAMCEHQLSHINDFAVMQSQQNIQELGQAMKTLNQYYDDSMGRALVEVPDDEGRETRRNPGDFSHGCQSDIVKGPNPVDYDGSTLTNVAESAAGRLIGKNMVNSPSRGTAEPEMRALYILLTMNNDGGMEVMKYSARLYSERPEIYNSKPVQLALNIFKAKKDYNYVRFFEYLRSPSTPYLFACIMFKHVEMMRKLAFRICSKTYGARKKDTGEPIYDAYPLKKLAHILCFEDLDEARQACKHYNITVKGMKVKSSTSGQVGMAEIVFWRHSEFKEARDPEKGTILPLRPWKMLRCIESKLNGATRLGVCRGEVSGEGASLSKVPTVRVAPVVAAIPTSQVARPLQSAPQPAMAQQRAPSEAELQQRQQELEKAEAKKKEAEKLRLKLEEKRLLDEREKKKREKLEEMKRQKEATRLAEEQARADEKQRQRELKEQREQEEQERAEKAAIEAARLQEEERQRKIEAARQKMEADRKEKQRLEDLRREEEERKQQAMRAEQERRRKEEEARIRKEEEMKRLEVLRLQEEERKRQEAIARKKAQELEDRVNKAKKLLLLRRWQQQLPRKFKAEAATKQSIKNIDPTFSGPSPFKANFLDREIAVLRSPAKPKKRPTVVDTRKILNGILAKDVVPLDVTSMMLDLIGEDEELMQHMRSRGFSGNKFDATKSTLLLKVAVVLPEPCGLEEESMYESIHTWLNKRLEYGKIDTIQRVDPSVEHTSEARVLFVKADSWNDHLSCDAAMFIIPPSFCGGDWSNSRKVESISSAFGCIAPETPSVAYILAEHFDAGFYEEANLFLTACLPNAAEAFPVVFPSAVSESALEGSLKASLKSLIKEFTREFPPVVEQVSVIKLASRCISDTLWKGSTFDALECARETLVALQKELNDVGQTIEDSWLDWPAEEFSGADGLVTGYFGENLHLPTSWTSRVFRETAKSKIIYLHQLLEKSVPHAVNQLICDAPLEVQEECEDMLEQRHYRKCLHHALQCCSAGGDIFYLPQGTAETIATATTKSILGNAGSAPLELSQTDGYYDDEDVEDEANISASRTATAPPDSQAVDDASVFQRAQDIFAPSRTISPVPPPMMTPIGVGMSTPGPTLDTPAPGTVSPPPGISSANKANKRRWTGMATGGMDFHSPLDFHQQHQDSNFEYYSSNCSATKRPREAAYYSREKSRDERESSAFTKKLQALLKGDATVDMDVGDTRLSRLVRNTPLLDANDPNARN